jgi:NitT/TauT family transport system substrate-binding protein
MNFRKFVTGLVTFGLFVVCCAVGTSRAEKLLVGYSGISADLSHLWIANQASLFKKYGGELVPIYFSGGNRLMQALIANDIQIGITSGISSARAIVAGADITIVAGHINKPTYTLYTSKEITKAEQLKGKSIAISGFGTTSHASTMIALRKLGLNQSEGRDSISDRRPSEPLRGAPSQYDDPGHIDRPPLTTMAKSRGFTPLMDLTQIPLPWSQEVVLANENFIEKQPALARNFIPLSRP